MAAFPRSALLFSSGGDVATKYGTLTRRYQIPQLGGEGMKETFSRTGTAWFLNSAGLLQAAAGGIARVEWALDPVNNVLQPYLLLEAAATNVVLQNRDMTQAAWTKTTMTPALDQVGIDGAANSASSLLATGSNATCLQAITLGSSARFQSAWVKRLVGSGAVNMTTDNGVTWNAISPTTAWTRVNIPTQTLANPTVGFRLVTNGDKIAVDGVQNETGTFQTSTIFTTSAAVTRNADSFTVPWYVVPGALWRYTRMIERGGAFGANFARLLGIGSSTHPEWALLKQSGTSQYFSAHHNGTVEVDSNGSASPVIGQVYEALELLGADGSIQLIESVNGAAQVANTKSSANAFAASWATPNLGIDVIPGGASQAYMALSRLLIGTGPGTLVSTIADARAIPV